MCAKKVTDIKEIRSQVEARRKEEQEKFGSGNGSGGGVDSRFVMECLYAGELGLGMLYAELHRGKFIYNKATREWLIWKGHHWGRDMMDRHLAAVENVVDRYLEEAAALDGQINDAVKNGDLDSEKRLSGHREKIYSQVKYLRSDKGRNATIKFAHTCKDPLAIAGNELDLNPWLLACINGVIDLITGKLRDGRPEDYISKACPVEWKGIDESAPAWEKALIEIFSERGELVAFVQRLFGYGITGLTTEHVFPVLHGQGRNGKSMIVEAISNVLGYLAGPIQSEMLLDQFRAKSSAGPSPDIMALKGLRLALASETDEGRKISPSRVKWLTGGDTLVGRNPHDKYEIHFKPTHMLILLTNHTPQAPMDDFAFWERAILIPFERSFVDRPPRTPNELPMDKTLPEKLRGEGSGILSWLVRGCLLWQKEGLNPPEAVLQATGDYKRNEDLLGDFIDECLKVDPDGEVGATELYTRFEEWWQKNVSKRVPKQRKFGQWMSKRFEKLKQGGIYKYFGIKLNDTWSS